MTRPITLFTGQWADLPFEEICKLASQMGFEGLEIACWGDHMDVRKAASDAAYVADRKRILEKYGLKCWALGSHLTGQCVGDNWDNVLIILLLRNIEVNLKKSVNGLSKK
jgi:sugar phosphate isomerase/epimerase